jgi:amino acid adenylation domain-containing protein
VGQSWSAARLLRLDADAEDLNSESGDNPAHVNTAESLAYVMYTSGSTGRPKGVMVNHRAVVRLVKNTRFVDLSEQEVFLQFSPISFDASTLEIWAPLLNGGCLAIMPPEIQSLEEIGAAIRKYGVTSMWLTAGLFNVMVEQRLDDLRPLRQLLVGGDVLSPTHIRKALDRFPGCRLINGYGPTEGTTFTCCHTITRADAQGASIPIGKPISNTKVYLLDATHQPVPLGEAGELCVGGDGLARGYLNQPELTAEKFVPDPFSDEPGSFIYRTGDLARYRNDGTIEFLGRVDDQVKISGFRIELGEIETVLMEHSNVQSAVVVARQDTAGEKKLVAYVVLRRPDDDRGELRAFLQKKLPAYMVPSEFVALNSLPLSPNGKVDRGALPAPETMQRKVVEAAVSPQTDLEQEIAGIWRRVLCLEQVSINDNFFDLGGDSLQLLDAHAELQKIVSSNITVVDLFEYTTIGALAKYLAKSGPNSHVLDAQERARKQQLAWAQHRQSRVQNP